MTYPWFKAKNFTKEYIDELKDIAKSKKMTMGLRSLELESQLKKYLKVKHNDWNEFITFTFENAKITLRYNSPMQRGGSCNLEIMDSNKSEQIIKSYKNNWTYETQGFNFINQIIRLKKGKLKEIYNGRVSINTYEKIWKSLLKEKN